MREAVQLMNQRRKDQAKQAEREHHAEEERTLREKEAAEEQKAFEIQKLAAAMREVEKKLASFELTQMEEAIAAQVQKDAKERKLADKRAREISAQVTKDTEEKMKEAALIKEREHAAATEAALVKEREHAAATEAARSAERKEKMAEDLKTTQAEEANQKADEILKAEADLLNQATLGLNQARKESPPRKESTPERTQGSVGTNREMMTPSIEAHVNTQPGSVGKDTQRTRKDILSILPKDLTKEQVDTVRKTVKSAVMNGYIFDRAERRRLLKCEFAERYKEIIRTMDDKVASEINDRMIEELDKAQEQWVQSDFEGIEYESEEISTSMREITHRSKLFHL